MRKEELKYAIEDLACDVYITNLTMMGADCAPLDIDYENTTTREDGTIPGRWEFHCHVSSPDHHALISGVWYEGHKKPSHLKVDIIPSF